MPQVQSKGEASSFDQRNAEAQDPSRSQDRALQAKERSASREEALAKDAEAASGPRTRRL